MKKIGVTKAALILNLFFVAILGMISVPSHSAAASYGGADSLFGKGSVVEMAKTYNEYVRVKDKSGPAGWIPKHAVKAIIPDHPVG